MVKMNDSSVHPTLDMATNTINDWRDVWWPSSCNASQLPQFLILYPFSGASTQGGMVRDGGNFVIIMMLLLVYIIIYYYMNTFITLHHAVHF